MAIDLDNSQNPDRLRLEAKPGRYIVRAMAEGGVTIASDGSVLAASACETHQDLSAAFLNLEDKQGLHNIELMACQAGRSVTNIELLPIKKITPKVSQSYAFPAVAGMATIPRRLKSFQKVVKRLLSQLDHLFVYLNGFEFEPDFLRHDKITVFRSQDYGDFRDNSKFFGLYALDGSAYYLTIDDDINYPRDYVSTLISRIDHYNRQAIVGAHGAIYGPMSRHFKDRITIHFGQELPSDIPVSVLGTGTTGFHTSTLDIDCLAFHDVGMADLMLAQEAQQKHVPMIAIEREAGWMTPINEDLGGTLYDESLASNSKHSAFIRNHAPWGFGEISGRIKVHDAVDRRLSDAAKDLLRFGGAIESGVDLMRVVSPCTKTAQLLADQFRWTPWLLACWRGDVVSRWGRYNQNKSVQDHHNSTQDLVVESHVTSPAIVQEIELFVHEAISCLDNEDGSIDFLQQNASEGLISTTRIDDIARWIEGADPILAALFACIEYLEKPTIPALASAFALVSNTKCLELTNRLASLLRQGGKIHGIEFVMASMNLRVGDIGSVLAAAPALVEAGKGGWGVLASAGRLAGLGWSEDLAIEVLTDVRDQYEVRDVNGFTELFRRPHRNSAPASSWISGRSRMSPATANNVAGVLISRKEWPDGVTVPKGQSHDESVIWNVATQFIKSGGDKNIVRHGLNKIFLRHGMIPVSACTDEGIFLEQLASEYRVPSKSEGPLVTIMIAAFNSADTLPYALRSILHQTYLDIQVIVVDDHSVSPVELPEWFSRSVDSQIIRLDVNSGPYVCRNVGLEYAQGDFIVILDADDWMHPQKIERQVRSLKASEAIANYTRHLRVQRDGMPALENNGRFVGDGPMTSMFKREVFDRIGGFLPVRSRGDMEFKARMVNRFGGNFIMQDEAITLLALDDESSNSRRYLANVQHEDELKRFKQWYHMEHQISCFRASEVLPGDVPRLVSGN